MAQSKENQDVSYEDESSDIDNPLVQLPKSRYLPNEARAGATLDAGRQNPRRRATKESVMTWRMRREGYVTCREIAQRVGVHKATVYRWINDGLIESVDFNGAYYIKWDSVIRHLGAVAEILELTPKGSMAKGKVPPAGKDDPGPSSAT